MKLQCNFSRAVAHAYETDNLLVKREADVVRRSEIQCKQRSTTAQVMTAHGTVSPALKRRSNSTMRRETEIANPSVSSATASALKPEI